MFCLLFFTYFFFFLSWMKLSGERRREATKKNCHIWQQNWNSVFVYILEWIEHVPSHCIISLPNLNVHKWATIHFQTTKKIDVDIWLSFDSKSFWGFFFLFHSQNLQICQKEFFNQWMQCTYILIMSIHVSKTRFVKVKKKKQTFARASYLVSICIQITMPGIGELWREY